jgi:asparagine synthase (glutamine-hydrolysing)
MCGIVGVFSQIFEKDKTWHSEKAEKMLSRIIHRGYMSFRKVESFNSFTLGCVRLPIVDEAKGTQPFLSESGRIALVFNGEIYNFLALRERYLSGKQLKTESDAEVLANLIELLGIENTLSLIEGMFAFIAYDFLDKKFYVARDFIGIKPVYIAEGVSDIAVASELKAFDNDGSILLEVPPQHYYDSLVGLKRWNFGTGNKKKANLRDLISMSVRDQVQTALPIAVFLSGGIDSSIICYEANHYHPDVTAFAIGKEDSSDMLTAERYCNEFKFKFVPIVIDEQEILASIEDAIFCIESFEPNHIRAGALSYLLSKYVAARGYRIALCGEGADELFAGYPDLIENMKSSGNNYAKLDAVLQIFMNQLYLTQLKRVDRTGMRFSLEVRPPFLSSHIVSYATSLPAQSKLIYQDGNYITKYPLREAYRAILPAYIVHREKSVFTEGAGFDTNTDRGPFWEFTKDKMTQAKIDDIKNAQPQHHLKNHEEVYYFSIFQKHFDTNKTKPERLMMSSL